VKTSNERGKIGRLGGVVEGIAKTWAAKGEKDGRQNGRRRGEGGRGGGGGGGRRSVGTYAASNWVPKGT